jgi:hypothetical protein
MAHQSLPVFMACILYLDASSAIQMNLSDPPKQLRTIVLLEVEHYSAHRHLPDRSLARLR